MKRSSGNAVNIVVIGIFLALGFGSICKSIYDEVGQARDLDSVDYVRSATCVRCHPVHQESWKRTFHRTMTQVANSKSVRGDFNNASFTYDGVTSRFLRDGDDFFIETIDEQGRMTRYRVERTVGSRRFQQYLTKVGDRFIRLPLAWNIEEKRWFHLNGGFLDPDGSDFNKHRALWDANCIFCHNVKAAPGYDWQKQTFSSKVAELGIACEACHGPGKEHIEYNRNPLRRYFLYYSNRDDPTIINPAKLPRERSIQVCGHCHGQRTPNPLERIRELLSKGDPYTAGSDLNKYTTPIWIHSKLAGVDLSLRFWKDGTPRLSAYEYQGILQSKGHEKSNLTCISCHNMHGGDPHGMIDEQMRGQQGCLQCHKEIAKDIRTHTRHNPQGAGSDCYSCHMPKMTYGLLTIHPTHRIHSPDPSRAWKYQMPDACTICHTNKTAVWAAKNLSELYGLQLPELPIDEQYSKIAETVRTMFAGDVVQRAVAIESLRAEKTYTADPFERLWAVPLLLVAMNDRYAAIRHFAYRSLKTLVARAAQADARLDEATSRIAKFDPQAPPEERQRRIAEWRSWWVNLDKSRIRHPGSEVPLDEHLLPIEAVISNLLAQQDDKDISIGE
ncbi:MAG: cytochrome c3 family protein [Acidobacteriota bacterium]|nr:hypothetical protein [Blastocatellia bacterium]MDW8412243.1 cytochrome c3 family protein [Acidobacteriota bacterium]